MDLGGEPAAISITWGPLPPPDELRENTFGFSLDGAYAQEIGVTTNTNTFTYDYRLLNATAPVQEDSDLNKLNDAGLELFGAIADVNHLDLCLAAADDEVPFISIDAPLDGAEVSGDVRIIATIRDDSGLLAGSVTIEIFPVGSTVPVDSSLIIASDPVGDVYQWTFKSSEVPTGSYIIKVSA